MFKAERHGSPGQTPFGQPAHTPVCLPPPPAGGRGFDSRSLEEASGKCLCGSFCLSFWELASNKGTAWQGSPCSWVGVGTVAGRAGGPAGPVPPFPWAVVLDGWLGQCWAPGPSLMAPASQERRRRCEMTLTLAPSPIPLALKVLLHVGLVRSEHCGVLAECPLSIFSSFLLNVCQKTTVITHEQGKFPSSWSPEQFGSAL